MVDNMSAVVSQLDIEVARRRAERIRFHATAANDSLVSLQKLIHQARELEDHATLGYPSWTAYVLDLFGDEPLRLARDVRRELVAELADAGMSTRAIAPIVGVSVGTVHADRQVFSSEHVDQSAPAPVEVDGMTVNPATGEVINGNTGAIRDALQDAEDHGRVIPITGPGSVSAPAVTEHTFTEKVKTVTGLDGKTYTQKPAPKVDRRRSLVDDAYNANTKLWEAVERIRTLTNDDRFTRNKADILAALQPSADLAKEILADLFNPNEGEK